MLHSRGANQHLQGAVLCPSSGKCLLPATPGLSVIHAYMCDSEGLMLTIRLDCSDHLCLLMWVQAEGQEVASVVSAQEIRVVAELLQVSPEGLQKSVTVKTTVCTPHLHRSK